MARLSPWGIFDDNILVISGPDEGSAGLLRFAAMGTFPDAENVVDYRLYEFDVDWIRYSPELKLGSLKDKGFWVEDLQVSDGEVFIALNRGDEDEMSLCFRFTSGRWAVLRENSQVLDEGGADRLIPEYGDRDVRWEPVLFT